MNKSDLINGLVVTLRLGEECLVVGNMLIKNNFRFSMSLNSFNEDLTHKESKYSDIVKVQQLNKECVLWERKEVDWSKVPVGTKVLVSDNENNWYKHLFINYRHDEEFKFKAVGIKSRQIHNWKYCKLAEEPKEEVTFYDVNKKMDSYCEKNNKSCDQACGPCVTKYILDNYDVTRRDVK